MMPGHLLINPVRNQRGMALAIVLLVMALIVALVVEFARNVQLGTDQLYNWQTAQKLSLAADSGVSVAAKVIERYRKENMNVSLFLPPYPVFDQDITVSLEIQDETARFHLNRLFTDNTERQHYKSFVRLVEALELEEEIAARIADWIDPGVDEYWPGSELHSPNRALISVEELLQVPGMDTGTYAKLKRYVTVFGTEGVNMNLAEVPVLLTLSTPDKIWDSMAEQVVEGRKEGRYSSDRSPNEVVPGIMTLQPPLALPIYKGNFYSVVATATSGNGLKRIIECVLDGNGKVHYWKEY